MRIERTEPNRSNRAQLGGLLGFITGAALGGGIPDILGAPMDVPGILGAGVAMALVGAMIGRYG